MFKQGQTFCISVTNHNLSSLVRASGFRYLFAKNTTRSFSLTPATTNINRDDNFAEEPIVRFDFRPEPQRTASI